MLIHVIVHVSNICKSQKVCDFIYGNMSILIGKHEMNNLLNTHLYLVIKKEQKMEIEHQS